MFLKLKTTVKCKIKITRLKSPMSQSYVVLKKLYLRDGKQLWKILLPDFVTFLFLKRLTSRILSHIFF